MIPTLTKKLKQEKIKEKFKFKRTNGIAGCCPDCGGVVYFNYFIVRYECTNKDCVFMADEEGFRLTDNSVIYKIKDIKEL